MFVKDFVSRFYNYRFGVAHRAIDLVVRVGTGILLKERAY
jgi:hypothetical protein